MAFSKIDGAGLQKLKTIEEAQSTMQTIHGHVERMAMEIKNQRGPGVIPQQIKRIASPLQGQLKGQFGTVADQVSAMILVLGRGGSDQLRVRAMRPSPGRRHPPPVQRQRELHRESGPYWKRGLTFNK